MSAREALLAAIVLGLVSLPHCLAMCGPLAAAGVCQRAGAARWRDAGGYLLGRAWGYMMAGALLGALGHRLQRGPEALWLGRGALALLVVGCLWQAFKALRPGATAAPPGEAARSDGALVTLRTTRPRSSFATPGGFVSSVTAALPRRGLGLGLVTAILPCGTLFAAWGLAAASAHPVTGAGAMLVFATASSPSLVGAIAGQALIGKLRARVPPALVAAAWLCVGAWLAGRLWLVEQAACHH